jgi:hypothetical protein
VPAGPLRTVDLFPGMLEWLGYPVPHGIDGELVWLPGEHRLNGKTRRPAVVASASLPADEVTITV